MLHFVIHSKLEHTFHYLYCNFGTPTPYLSLHSTAQLTKQTSVVLKIKLGPWKSHFFFQSTFQKESIIVKFQLSSNFAFPRTLENPFVNIVNFVHVSLCNPQQTSIHIWLLKMKLWHSYIVPCFVLPSSLNKRNICCFKNSTVLVKFSSCFWEHTPKGTHYSMISTIL